ncbi:hypothetical protein [Methanothermobacter sp.]
MTLNAYDKKLKKRIVEEAQNVVNLDRIAEKYRLDTSTIRTWMRKAGVKPLIPANRVDKQILELYLECGYSPEEIAEKVNKPKKAVSYILNQYPVTRPSSNHPFNLLKRSISRLITELTSSGKEEITYKDYRFTMKGGAVYVQHPEYAPTPEKLSSVRLYTHDGLKIHCFIHYYEEDILNKIRD